MSAGANFGRPDLDHLVKAAHVPAGEPKFLLRGRDPAAAGAVRAWASLARELGVTLAVIEQALVQADAMDAWAPKRLPDAEHLTEPERKQLEYQHDRRAWRAHVVAHEDRLADLAVLLAERRGWRAAMAHVRLGRPIEEPAQ